MVIQVSKKKWLHLIRSKRLQHLLFWMFSFYVLYRLFRYSSDTVRTDLIYTFLFHLSLLPVFYLNVEWLIPFYLRKNRYGRYGFGILSILLLGTVINYVIFRYWTNWIFPGYYFISYFTFFEILQFMGAYWAVSTLLTLSRSWYRLREQDKLIQQLEQERISAELRALKAQLDPHFLFNSLNGIYSLALYDDPRTSDALLKLSSTMRYVLYECQAPLVSLEREWAQVVDFLTLHQMRSPVALDLHVPDHLDLKAYSIPPLLILPLVENACKHSRPTPAGHHAIRVQLEQKENRLHILCANTFRNAPSNTKQEEGGLGMVNFRKRLELMYPGMHTFHNQRHDHWFFCQLSVPLTQKSEI